MYRTNISVQVNGGTAPYTAEVYDPIGNLVGTATSASNPVWVNNLPQLPAGQQYRVVGKDACNRSASQFISPVASTFNRNSVITPKCPSGTYQNGSSDFAVTVTSTLGAIVPQITAKNGAVFTLNYSSQSGNTFTWVDLPPATYVVTYSLPAGCVNKLYDTLTVGQYTYPALDKSAAYQCDNNNFSVGASVSGGAAPFMYEVIGSVPSAPSIVTPQQGGPVFNVTNGTVYSLVRLRAIDACGNATLNDVSILPLANIAVTANANCYYQDIILQVDTIPNATYEWFRKTSPTDSVSVGTLQSHTIPYLLPVDTGTYVCKVSVNSGCLTKLSYFRVNGACYGLLPVKEVTLYAKPSGSNSELTWISKEEKAIKEYQLERSTSLNGRYMKVGSVNAKAPASINDYLYLDRNPEYGTNYYRLKIVDLNGKSSYSNVVTLNWMSHHKVMVYPNPARDVVNISVKNGNGQNLQINLYTVSGQLVAEKVMKGIQNNTITINRNNLIAGMYLLKITDASNGESFTQKVIFE